MPNWKFFSLENETHASIEATSMRNEAKESTFGLRASRPLAGKFNWPKINAPEGVQLADWNSWTWQMRNGFENTEDFAKAGHSVDSQEAFAFDKGRAIFAVRSTPYYAQLMEDHPQDPIRKILMPKPEELQIGAQSMLDPLGERKNSPVPRLIHRYPDRVLFLVTDQCSVYCRFCTRKHFTGQSHAKIKNTELAAALDYLRSHPGIREVILSGGDPLTLGDSQLDEILLALREIPHLEVLRIGTRMPVVCPMRITPKLLDILQMAQPLYLMTHFNHPREITLDAATALTQLVNHGVPVMNQMVLLNGVNNHPAIVQALSRRLLYLRVKPYYCFQADPSEGTDHLRTSLEETEQIQRELWGTLSGLAMPQFSVDIPDGGGKTSLVPNFELHRDSSGRKYRGWDGVTAEYCNPSPQQRLEPRGWQEFAAEWELTRNAKVPQSETTITGSAAL